jgi:hypothetical protein
MILLPEMINYDKYYSNSGASTVKWGKSGWDFLFISIIAGYPVQIVNTNRDHMHTKKSFKNIFKALQYTLPCIYCRESYVDFFKKIKIDNFLTGRIELMYWLYLIKDCVNKKLILQEIECCKIEKNRLKKLYITNQISFENYRNVYEKFKKETMVTEDSPSFIKVLDKYEMFRSTCSKKAKKCQ